jgi:hypothetical protein
MQSGDASRTVLLSLSLDSLLGDSCYPIAIAQTCEMFRSACVNPTVLQTRKLREASNDELSWLITEMKVRSDYCCSLIKRTEQQI